MFEECGVRGPVAVSGHAATPDYDLLRGGSELLDVALLAARGSAAARRLAYAEQIDSDDERSLTALAELLEASAAAVQSFGADPSAVAPPSGGLATRADVAIEAVLHDADPSIDVASLARVFEDLAARVRELLDGRDPAVAQPIVDALAHLAASVLRETGHVGEITSTL